VAERSETALERRLRGHLISLYKYLIREVGYSKDDRARLLVVPSDSTRSNGDKTEHNKFHQNIRKQFSTVTVVTDRNSVPTEAVGSQSLETSKI